MKKTNLDRKEIKRLYLEEKLSMEKIGKIFNCTYKPIKRILEEMSIKIKKNIEFFTLHLDNEKIKEMYLDGKSCIEIAKIMECCSVTILKRLKEMNVKTREANFQKGNIPHNKGKTKENYEPLRVVAKKVSKTRKKLFKEGKIIRTWKGKHLSEETKRKASESHKKRWKNPEWRKKVAKVYQSKKFREDISKRMKKDWKNPKQREKRTRSYVRWRQETPNKEEIFLNKLIQSNFPNEWLFNVNAEVIFYYKYVPDWINVNGQKKVILHHGIFWHLIKERYLRKNPNLTRRDIEKEEQKKYGKYGFTPCVVWEDELEHPKQVVNKIKEFMVMR